MGSPSRRMAAACGLIALGFAGAGFGAGCGAGTNNAISASASAALSQQVDSVKAAAAGRDTAGARDRLTNLRALVARLQTQGQISAPRAAEILAAATDVGTQLGALPVPTTAVPTVAPTVAPAPSTPGKAGGHGGDRGKGGGGGGGD